MIPAEAMKEIAKVEASWDGNGASTCGWQGYCWPSLGEPCGQCHRRGRGTVIPAEAVEAAMRAWLEWAKVPGSWSLDGAARAALEAAAPYMQVEAWEEGYTLGYADCANKQESNRPNPYMLNNEGEK